MNKEVLVKVILDEEQFKRYIFDPDEPERMAEIKRLVGEHNISYIFDFLTLIDKIGDVCYGEFYIDYSLRKNCITVYLFQE